MLIKADDNGMHLNETRFKDLVINYRYENEMIQADQENYLVERLKAKGFRVYFSLEKKKKAKLECQHPDIDDYLEIIASGRTENLPETNLFQNINDRIKLLKIDEEVNKLDEELKIYCVVKEVYTIISIGVN